MREVLPGGREHRSVGSGEKAQHLLARDSASERDAPVQREVPDLALESGALGAVACNDQRDVGHVAERLQEHAERLLRPQTARENEHVPVEPELAAELLARRHGRDLGRRVREHRDALRIEPPAQRHVTQVGARAEHVTRAAESSVARGAQKPCPGAAGVVLELVERPGVARLPRCALEHLVGDELHDQRPACEPGADARPV